MKNQHIHAFKRYALQNIFLLNVSAVLIILFFIQNSYAGAIHPFTLKAPESKPILIAQPSQPISSKQTTSTSAKILPPSNLSNPSSPSIPIQNSQNSKNPKNPQNLKKPQVLAVAEKELADDLKDKKQLKNHLLENTQDLSTLQTQIQKRDQQDLTRAQSLIDHNETNNTPNIEDPSKISFANLVVKNRILAVVNNNMITSTDVEKYLRNLKIQALQNSIAWHEPRDNIEKIILPRLIIDKIQLQRARDIGLKVDDSQMQAILQNLAAKQGLNLQQLRDQFNQEGVDFSQFIDETRQGILLSQLQERDFMSGISIKPTEVEEYIKRHSTLQGNNPYLIQTKLRHIVLRQDSADPELSQRQLQEIQKKLINQRQSFETMALLYSQDSTAAKGGSLGALFPEEMPVGLDEAIQNLAVGEISSVLKSAYGYHLVQVLDRQKIAVPANQQAKLIESILTEKKTEAAYQNWLKSLRAKAYVEYR